MNLKILLIIEHFFITGKWELLLSVLKFVRRYWEETLDKILVKRLNYDYDSGKIIFTVRENLTLKDIKVSPPPRVRAFLDKLVKLQMKYRANMFGSFSELKEEYIKLYRDYDDLFIDVK